jgi:hypothetical protein
MKRDVGLNMERNETLAATTLNEKESKGQKKPCVGAKGEAEAEAEEPASRGKGEKEEIKNE